MKTIGHLEQIENHATIPRSKSHRVLGVIFEDNLTFNEQANKVYKKMQKRDGIGRRFYIVAVKSISIHLVPSQIPSKNYKSIS